MVGWELWFLVNLGFSRGVALGSWDILFFEVFDLRDEWDGLADGSSAILFLSSTCLVREFVPNVIEPSFGIGRILYALIEHSWYRRAGDDEARNVLGFPVVTAPFKALVTPISSNPSFTPFINECAALLRRNGIANKVDESAASIGRRYARADELGTPFAVTVDFQTLKDQTVTLRERDSLKQIRESVGFLGHFGSVVALTRFSWLWNPQIPTVVQVIKDICDEKMSWDDVFAKYPEFTGQVLE